MITPASVLIHCTALEDKEMEKIREVGAKLVWSPESNLRLYGKTTAIAAALGLGIPVGIGADWLPSGSPTLMSELRVARRVLHNLGIKIDARKLVCMVTSGAAAIAGLEDVLGTIAPGRPADLLVLEKRQSDPWENVLAADPSWVELVVIGGDVVYGSERIVTDLLGAEKYEDVIAWGKAMLIDTGYLETPGEPGPRLGELRAKLIELYPQVGPIFV
jgi:cytosine/adenosine deaminase-related metal-dependent hydrolase